MTAQRHPANTDGPDWDAIWSVYVQQSDAHEIEAANDDEPEREPSRFGVGIIVLVLIVVGFSFIGAIQ